jgi:hypothetical protein
VRHLRTSLVVTPTNGNDSKEMLIMNHEAVLQAEMEFHRQRLLEEAEADRVAKQVREARSAR